MSKSTGHYIRQNETTRLPRRHIVIDTEAVSAVDGRREVQSWRLGVAAFMELRASGEWTTAFVDYDTPESMWHHISAFTPQKSRTVLWAHNLAYDLRISQALKWLHTLEWTLGDIRLSKQGTWARWKKGDRTLVCVDSYAIWPVQLQTLGATFGMGKPPLPTSDDWAAWVDRCQADVEILATAVRHYLDWLRHADMGSWQMTGAAQAYAAFRHRFLTHRMLVADDMDARSAERKAMWTGRAEAWKHGINEHETVYDWDWNCSYARIARDVDLPVRQVGIREGIEFSRLMALTSRSAVLAEVTVTTDAPMVPTEHEGRMLWPVGTFDTTLWTPELCLLHDAGVDVKVRRAWLYRKAPVLRAWALWILGELAKAGDDPPPWLRLILKHWSRALIGRFAMQYSAWEPFATADSDTLDLWSGHDLDTGEPFQLMQVGREVRQLSATQDGRDAIPAVTGFVMSEARRRLWVVMLLVGLEHVLYVDTDSLLVDAVGHKRLRALAGDPRVEGLRLKRKFRGWQIAGPRKAVFGGEPRIAGVPKKATQVGPWRFEGEVWRGLGESLRRGEPDVVTVTSRGFRVLKTDPRRRHLKDGRTGAIELRGQS